MAHSVAGKRLSDFPEIAVEFDVEANGGVTADQIAAGSGTNYWWRCDQGADHVWEAAVGDRTGSRHGCPFCRGLQVSVTNSLATLYPEVAAQLDPDRNGGVTAGQIVAGSGKKYWWRCEKGPDHVWETRSHGCR